LAAATSLVTSSLQLTAPCRFILSSIYDLLPVGLTDYRN
jgi:hypothetical protein